MNITKRGSLKASPAPRQTAPGRNAVFLPMRLHLENTVLAALTESMVSGEGNDCGCNTEAQPGECPAPRVLSQADAQPELDSSVPTPEINMYEHKTWEGDRQQGFFSCYLRKK